jgi:hypothetical protein
MRIRSGKWNKTGCFLAPSLTKDSRQIIIFPHSRTSRRFTGVETSAPAYQEDPCASP